MKPARTADLLHLFNILLLGALLAGLGAAPAAVQAADPIPASPTGSPVHILSESPSQVVLELETLEYRLAEGPDCTLLSAADYPETDVAGSPRLPVQGALVGLPPNGEVQITLVEAEPVLLEGSFSLCPVPRLDYEIQPTGEPGQIAEQWLQDPAAYSQDRFYPELAAELAGIGMIRSQRVAQVRFHPFQYHPVSGKIRYYPRIRVQLSFTETSGRRISGLEPTDEGAYEPIFQRQIVNYATASAWRLPASLPDLKLPETVPPGGAPAFKLQVSRAGFYQLTYADLQAAGANLNNADPHTLQIFNRGAEVAIQVTGSQDGAFNPGDAIQFYAEPLDTRYTAANAYWLTWGQAAGKRILFQDGAPDGAAPQPSSFQDHKRIEENRFYYSSFQDSSGDPWYWGLISAQTTPVSADYFFQLSQADLQSDTPARLRGRLKGFAASPQHHTRIYLNGRLIQDSFWAPTAELNFEASFPADYLVNGQNRITIECPLDNGITVDRLLVNWFQLDIPRTFQAEADLLRFQGQPAGDWTYQLDGFTSAELQVFDVEDPANPIQITGAQTQQGETGFSVRFQAASETPRRYLALTSSQFLLPDQIEQPAPAGLKATANGADYLLITHSSFAESIQPLADWRASRGLRVKLVTVQQIYNEFNYGISDPEAIRNFLAYAYHFWQPPAPQYVLLVGDGHYDPRNYKGTDEPVYVPAYLQNTDYYLKETAADNRYVTVSGDDHLPDMMIGRLPVRTPAEASALAAKIIQYEQLPLTGEWNNQSLFVTDNPDTAGDFYLYSNRVADHILPETHAAQKVYYGSTHLSVPAAQNAILEGINQGKAIVNYVGHGGTAQWASENLLNAGSVPGFSNQGKYPLFLSFACLTGYFHTPSPQNQQISALAEALVRPGDRGAIASWSSTGMGLASGQDYLDRGFFQAVFQDGETRLGAAVLQAKLFLASQSGAYPDLIDNYTLFGDPALELKVLSANLPAHISRATGIYTGENVEISWETDYELSAIGFNLYRSDQPQEQGVQINESLIPTQKETYTSGASYFFADTGVASGESYYYWIEIVDPTLSVLYAGPVVHTARMVYLPVISRDAVNQGE